MVGPICLYRLNCTIFLQLLLIKIIKSVATRYQILRLKYTKSDFGWSSAPDCRWGSLQRSPYSLARFEGAGKKGEGRDRREGHASRRKTKSRRYTDLIPTHCLYFLTLNSIKWPRTDIRGLYRLNWIHEFIVTLMDSCVSVSFMHFLNMTC